MNGFPAKKNLFTKNQPTNKQTNKKPLPHQMAFCLLFRAIWLNGKSELKISLRKLLSWIVIAATIHKCYTFCMAYGFCSSDSCIHVINCLERKHLFRSIKNSVYSFVSDDSCCCWRQWTRWAESVGYTINRKW